LHISIVLIDRLKHFQFSLNATIALGKVPKLLSHHAIDITANRFSWSANDLRHVNGGNLGFQRIKLLFDFCFGSFNGC